MNYEVDEKCKSKVLLSCKCTMLHSLAQNICLGQYMCLPHVARTRPALESCVSHSRAEPCCLVIKDIVVVCEKSTRYSQDKLI